MTTKKTVRMCIAGAMAVLVLLAVGACKKERGEHYFIRKGHMYVKLNATTNADVSISDATADSIRLTPRGDAWITRRAQSAYNSSEEYWLYMYIHMGIYYAFSQEYQIDSLTWATCRVSCDSNMYFRMEASEGDSVVGRQVHAYLDSVKINLY